MYLGNLLAITAPQICAANLRTVIHGFDLGTQCQSIHQLGLLLENQPIGRRSISSLPLDITIRQSTVG